MGLVRFWDDVIANGGKTTLFILKNNFHRPLFWRIIRRNKLRGISMNYPWITRNFLLGISTNENDKIRAWIWGALGSLGSLDACRTPTPSTGMPSSFGWDLSYFDRYSRLWILVLIGWIDYVGWGREILRDSWNFIEQVSAGGGGSALEIFTFKWIIDTSIMMGNQLEWQLCTGNSYNSTRNEFEISFCSHNKSTEMTSCISLSSMTSWFS